MKEFMTEDFLLQSETAKKLYHEYAAKMPIIDYHCHIDPQEIAEDKRYDNITQVWLYGDHYKWRAMRSNGVDERYITGDASDYEKFEKWAETLPSLIGNPLYHWAHLELKKYFDYHGALNAETAKPVWEQSKAKLAKMSVRSIIEMSDVELICTTDDPVDSLIYHQKIADDSSFKTKVLPAFRPDKALNIEAEGFLAYMDTLSQVSGVTAKSFSALKTALGNRIDFFGQMGCLASDHALAYVMCNPADEKTLEAIFEKRMKSLKLSTDEIEKFKTGMLVFLGKEYVKRGWVMQIHYGALRGNNSRMQEQLGPDTGFDCINTQDSAAGLAGLLDTLEINNALPKTIIYSLNPNDDAMIGSVIGCFQSKETKGKIQQGAAWWFNDTKKGMINQLESLASLSVLGNFVGMLTDSRSFLSYTRHEYFRRIFCNLVGGWVENGEYPEDIDALKKIVEDVSYNNTKTYFGF